MRPRLLTLLIALLLVGAVAPATAAQEGTATDEATVECAFPVTETDATGTAVTVEAEPERIVTLSPSAAQTMWEIGGREKVVGLTQYATYLEDAGSRADVSAGSGESFVSVEAVVGLEPDLVLAPNVIPDATVEQLRRSGLTVFKFGFARSIEDVETKTLLTGRLTGECAGAADTVAWMESELATVEEAVAGRERPRVLYVFFEYTAGSGTFAHRIIERAGGRNVAAEANISGYRPISEEVVIDRDPEWIVVNDGAPGVPKTAAYNGTTAVRRDQIVVLREPYVSQPAPRIVRSVVTLAAALHPEAYAAANATATETTVEPDTPTSTPVETSTGGQPGFGAALGLAGLVVGLLLRRRR